MNVLIDTLPGSVKIDEKSYAVNTGYRVMMCFEMRMQDASITDAEKLILSLCEFYRDEIPENVQGAVDQLLWFYWCGKDRVEEKKSGGDKAGAAIYSFDHDADYIYAAFLDQYGVDLQEVDLHWWKFKAMFRALRDTNEFVKIMGYRSMEISKDMTQEQKQFYRRMKELHRIPLPQNEQEKLREIESVLMGDGKL